MQIDACTCNRWHYRGQGQGTFTLLATEYFNLELEPNPLVGALQTPRDEEEENTALASFRLDGGSGMAQFRGYM